MIIKLQNWREIIQSFLYLSKKQNKKMEKQPEFTIEQKTNTMNSTYRYLRVKYKGLYQTINLSVTSTDNCKLYYWKRVGSFILNYNRYKENTELQKALLQELRRTYYSGKVLYCNVSREEYVQWILDHFKVYHIVKIPIGYNRNGLGKYQYHIFIDLRKKGDGYYDREFNSINQFIEDIEKPQLKPTLNKIQQELNKMNSYNYKSVTTALQALKRRLDK